MSCDPNLYRHLREYYRLSPAKRDAFVQQIVREAQAERAMAIRTFFAALAKRSWVSLARGLSALRVTAAAAWRRYQRRRCRRLSAARLYAMDDRMLKDIGLRRGEIDFIVSGKEDPTRRPPQPPSALTVVQGSRRWGARLNPSLP